MERILSLIFTLIWSLSIAGPVDGVLCQFGNITNVSCSLGCCANNTCCSFWTTSTIDLTVICSVFVLILLLNLIVRLVKSCRTKVERDRNKRLITRLLSRDTPFSPESGYWEGRHYDVDDDLQQSRSYDHHQYLQHRQQSVSISPPSPQRVEKHFANGAVPSNSSESPRQPSTSSVVLANGDLHRHRSHYFRKPRKYSSITVREYFGMSRAPKQCKPRTSSEPTRVANVSVEETADFEMNEPFGSQPTDRTRLLGTKKSETQPAVRDYRSNSNRIF